MLEKDTVIYFSKSTAVRPSQEGRGVDLEAEFIPDISDQDPEDDFATAQRVWDLFDNVGEDGRAMALHGLTASGRYNIKRFSEQAEGIGTGTDGKVEETRVYKTATVSLKIISGGQAQESNLIGEDIQQAGIVPLRQVASKTPDAGQTRLRLSAIMSENSNIVNIADFIRPKLVSLDASRSGLKRAA